MNTIINYCVTALNDIGRGFCNYSAGIFIQSSLLIVLLLLIDFLMRKRVRAIFRYWIWMLVFIKLILPPTLSLPTGIGYWCGDYLSSDSSVLKQSSIIAEQESIGIPAIEDLTKPSEMPFINEVVESAEITKSQNSINFAEVPQIYPSQTQVNTKAPILYESLVLNPITWQAVIFGLWLIGVLIILTLLIQRISFIKRLITQSEPSDERLAQMLIQCRRRLGIDRNIELRLSNNISGPAVCGLFKPVIFMPTTLNGKLSPNKLRAVLIHELAHIKRGDLWINLVQTVLQIINFYNPFVWIANAAVRSTREQAVDEMVLVALDAEAQNYSNTLIDIAEMAFLRTSLSLRLIGVVESKKALHRRIKLMLNRPVPKSARLGTFGLLIIIITAAILLPMAKAQKQSVDNTLSVLDLDKDGLENRLEEKHGTNPKSTDTEVEKSDETNNKASRTISMNIKVKPAEITESTKVDIAIDDKNLVVTKLSDELFQAVIRIYNEGSVPSPEFGVYFYAGDPDKSGRLLATHAAGPIMPGDSWGEYNPALKLRSGENTISVVVDPDNKVEESDETNNKASRTISMIVSESANVDKVGAIQKVDLHGDDILQVEAQASEGFNFPYYLFVPSGIDKNRQVYMLVETNNSGTVSDDLEFHRVKALMLAKRSHANRMAKRLGVPLLVPTFPRPRTNWQAYTHALDIDTLEMEEGKLKRVDLQLTAMIKYAQELLRINGFKINDRVFMHGFSASAKFCNRYSFLHPEMVKAVAAGGVNGLPTLPVRQWNECELPFPIGIAGIERFIDGPFNEETIGQVAHYIYMGSLDRNDTLPSRDAWREEEADIIKKALAEKMMPDRWELSRKIYRQQKLLAQLVTYNGVAHAIKSEMLDDVIDFFKANSEEKFVRIEPYEYPFVESKEIGPKFQTESTKIDIAIDDKNLTVTKQPDDRFRAGVSIHNYGNTATPQFKVIFYAGDPSKKGRKVYPGHHNAGPIMPRGTWNEGTLPFTLNEGETAIFVVVDPDNKVEESDETNNKASVAIQGRQPKKSVETSILKKQTAQTEAEMTANEGEKAVRKVSGIDIKPADFHILLDEKRGTCVLVVSIQNKSSLTIPKFRLNFYRGDPSENLDEVGNVRRGSHGAGPIEPGKKWNEGTRAFYLPDGQYDFNVFLDFDNRISEIDENNNQALLQVKIENGRITDKLVTCPSSPKETPAGSKVPAKMVGTWFFDNPAGDEEQMAIFPDGRVVVLYSNGHKDRTNIVNGFIELAEYNNAKCRMAVREDGIFLQYFGRSESSGKRWRRISPVPHTNLLRSLTGTPEDKWKYFVTLPGGITVELVGVCDWPKEGRRCWQPDGLKLPVEIYAAKWNQDPGAGQFGFMYKVTGPDDLKLSCNIFGANSTEGSCKVVDAHGRQLKNFTASISDMEEGRLSTTIRIGIAAGPWETIASHDGKRMKSGRQGGILWSQAFQSNSDTHIVTSRQWRKDQTDRVVAIDKAGKLHTAGGGSVASGKIDQHTANFRNLKLGQIEEFQFQTRPYQWVEFKNVSLRPGHKTDVLF
ncbi:MAG: M48 family metalloprotease [Planctomycetes bacterium]|nr:M48 family metalloprotease [Planctomycetota bacterium]